MTRPTAVARDAEIRHERRRRAFGLATFIISYVAATWPRVRETIDERDWLRLTGFAMAGGAGTISGIADIRRAPQKVKKDADRRRYVRAFAGRKSGSKGGAEITDRPWAREDVLMPAIGCAVAAVGAVIQLWYFRRPTNRWPDDHGVREAVGG